MRKWGTILALGLAMTQPAAADPIPLAKIAQHRCGPLAERLYLAAPRKPTPPKTLAQRAVAAAAAEVATWALPRRRMVWNFDCADRPGAPASRMAETPRAATMIAQGTRLSVAGEIDPDFATRLLAKLNANPEIATVALVSPGGYLGPAIEAGALIRARGLQTQAAGSCASACPLVFLGGTSRHLMPGVGRLGFHQASWESGVPVGAINPIQLRMGSHVRRMGAAPLPVLGWMFDAAPSEMLYPARRDLCAAGLATRPSCPGVPTAKR